MNGTYSPSCIVAKSKLSSLHVLYLPCSLPISAPHYLSQRAIPLATLHQCPCKPPDAQPHRYSFTPRTFGTIRQCASLHYVIAQSLPSPVIAANRSALRVLSSCLISHNTPGGWSSIFLPADATSGDAHEKLESYREFNMAPEQGRHACQYPETACAPQIFSG